ncbi:MAG: hypothetical protein U0821_14000 [Chloroflexota bacterium]
MARLAPISMSSRLARSRLLADLDLIQKLAVTGLGNAAGRGLGLAFAIISAGLLTAEDYGSVRWAMSVGMVGSIPATAGAAAIARAVAAAGDPVRQRTVATVGLLLMSLAALLCGAVTAAALIALDRPWIGPAAVLLGMTLFAAVFNVCRGVSAAGRMAALYAGGNALALGVLIVAGLAGLATPLFVLVTYAAAWLLILSMLGPIPAPALRGWPSATRDIFRTWLPLILAHAAYTAWTWGDIVLVEATLGSAAAGAYGLAKTFVTVFLLVPETVAMLLMPRVAAWRDRAAGLTRELLIVSGLVSLILLAGLLLIVPSLLPLFGGSRYLAAVELLPGLGIAMALYALYMVLEGHLVGMGRAGAHAAAMTAMAITGLALITPLVQQLGAGGAGWAMAASSVIGLAALTIAARRDTPPLPPNPPQLRKIVSP